MKRSVRLLTVAMALVVLCMALASCSNISESYAKKINKAAEDKEPYTLDQVKEDLGDEAVEITLLGTGVVIAVKGCDSVEDIKEQLKDGKTVKGIIVTVALGKATAAKYTEITEDDLKI